MGVRRVGRVQAVLRLPSVRKPVTIRVGIVRVRTQLVLLEVREAVTVTVLVNISMVEPFTVVLARTVTSTGNVSWFGPYICTFTVYSPGGAPRL